MRVTSIAAAALVVAGTHAAGAVVHARRATPAPRHGVTLRMTHARMGEVLSPGDAVAFRVRPEAESAVIVFDIDTRGVVHLLAPEPGLDVVGPRETLVVPRRRDETLLVEGEDGIEFVFAMAVEDPDAIDREALEALRRSDAGEGEPYRITGDPFLAANTIAGDLVRGISTRSGVTFDYTWFYVGRRVAYPCYLCGECDDDDETDCDRYLVEARLDRARPLSYPLRAAYAMVETRIVERRDDVRVEVREVDDDDGVTIQFYPYVVEVDPLPAPVVYRVWDPGYCDPWFYDPWVATWGWGAFDWGFRVGFGWGHLSSWWWDPWWYDPWWNPWPYGYGDGHGHHHGGFAGHRPPRFKRWYHGGESVLVGDYTRRAARDPGARIRAGALRERFKTVHRRERDLASRAAKHRVRTRVRGGIRADGERPAIHPRRRPARRSGERPAIHPKRRPARRSGERPAIHPKRRPARRSGERPAIHPRRRPARRSGERPAVRPRSPRRPPAVRPAPRTHAPRTARRARPARGAARSARAPRAPRRRRR